MIPPGLVLVATLTVALLSGCSNTGDVSDAEYEEWLEQQRLEDHEEEERFDAEQDRLRELEFMSDRAWDIYSSWYGREGEREYYRIGCDEPTEFGGGCLAYLDEVVDGDTLRMENGDLVRLVGVNAPEVHPESECFGEEAKRRLEAMVWGPKKNRENPLATLGPSGKSWERPVRLSAVFGHPDRDVHGRLLRQVAVIAHLPTEKKPYRVGEVHDLGYWLMQNGLARFDDYAFRHYATTPDRRQAVQKGLRGYLGAENRNKGGYVECGWK